MFFSNKELDEVKQCGLFMVIGETGAGKSTLLNAVLGKDVDEIGHSSSSVTKNTEIYYLRLKNGKSDSLIDIPRLPDTYIIDDNEANKFHINLKK